MPRSAFSAAGNAGAVSPYLEQPLRGLAEARRQQDLRRLALLTLETARERERLAESRGADSEIAVALAGRIETLERVSALVTVLPPELVERHFG